ncbi:DUF937 domain-containing protein [uncultured Dysgonomonas sp.]|uniref:DUF937 domain-containing protein n=1 Tax=uncultured Dysgonomonas sp. TaxID=206096 RepID=A0A212K219_9BACT|nr:DUF937 domain-containing protein [uncultured Dysgonomonas sp.]SBW05713.1 conserved hypothetical protein [uncultured Dysgonomonas sp.]
MLDGIIDLVKDQALGAITNNAGVPADKKEAAVETTTSAVVNGLKDQLTPDNLSNILGMFSGGSTSSSNLTSGLQSSVVSALSDKVGLSPAVANSIASTVIPAIMGLISKKHNDSNDSFSLESLVESVTGKQGGGILGALGGLFGK